MARLEQLLDEHASIAALDPAKLPGDPGPDLDADPGRPARPRPGPGRAPARRRVRRLPAARRRLAVRGQGRPDPRRPARARAWRRPGRAAGRPGAGHAAGPADLVGAGRRRCPACARRSAWPRTAGAAGRGRPGRGAGPGPGRGRWSGRLAARRRPGRSTAERARRRPTSRSRGCCGSPPPSSSRGWRRPPASSTPSCTRSTAATSRPGRAGRRCAAWSTCCRPAATSTPSTPRRCRPGWPGRPASSWPTRCWPATARTPATGRPRSACRCGAPPPCAPPATTSPRCWRCSGCGRVWDEASRRVTGLEVIGLAELGRPRIDVVVRISGFFRDAFPHVVTHARRRRHAWSPAWTRTRPTTACAPTRWPTWSGTTTCAAPPRRIFGSPPGAYGAGLLPLIDSRSWRDDADLAEVYAVWGGHAYGRGLDGRAAREDMEARLPADRGRGQEHRHPRARHRRLRRLLPVPRRAWSPPSAR